MKKILKKWYLYLIIIAVIGLGFFLVYKLAFANENKNLIEININELQDKVNNEEDFVLVISQTGCPHCEQYLPELQKTIEKINFKVYLLNLSNIKTESDAKALSLIANISGTPTTLFFKNGKETTSLNRIVGYTNEKNIIARLESLGYID